MPTSRARVDLMDRQILYPTPLDAVEAATGVTLPVAECR
jgi:hypothetical protein